MTRTLPTSVNHLHIYVSKDREDGDNILQGKKTQIKTENFQGFDIEMVVVHKYLAVYQ